MVRRYQIFVLPSQKCLPLCSHRFPASAAAIERGPGARLGAAARRRGAGIGQAARPTGFAIVGRVSNSDAPGPQRGRPTVLDRAAIAAETFRLWKEHGFAAVSWRDIAEATGVSVRTLVRHFPRKSDIAWIGVPAATRRLREALDDMSEDIPVDEAARRAIVASISDDPMTPAGPDWIHVVCTEPEIVGTAPTAYRSWIEVLARFIDRRVPTISPIAATAIASGYQAAAFAALVAWSEGRARGNAAAAADEALAWLAVPTRRG